ncbi:uncharacterized protein FOMMEDRAFT_133416 [Fomitiporia mediterranea MF3/22]|uniref:uncharacterized protein n=1 Tax=Fomitiporia mediterranea (strain MF3/22) TaxID=694068 RepID=UPI0004407808|nr:uncharacterized protein FOMMEDRAFT_133416 [Fomitiporia mediterranea MF3/22]EJD04068.1 hypothetical protein FOMMEDRAFT_133416 [Fomitiporia mediterranea MF3/22]
MSSAPSDDLLAKVPPAVAIDAYTGLPAAPSRSPSPPAAPPNSRYTEQDAIYFYRRIAYDLARNPNLSKANLCDILGEKAPHHTGVAWRSYWHKHEDVADKMYLLTQLVDQDREKAIQSWRGGGNVVNGNSRPRTISYKESSDSEAGEEDTKAGFSSESEEESSDDEDENDRLDTDENEKLGVAGSIFTMAEYRVLAKHIAICPDWFNGYRDWEPFTIAYPQRTPASWREIYRRRQDEIDALARRYMKKARKTRERISARRGRPSWARQNHSAASSSVAESTGSVKRRYSEDDLREQLKEKKSKLDD